MLGYITNDYINFKTLVYAVKSKDLNIFIKVYRKYPDKTSLVNGYYDYQMLAKGAAAFSLPIFMYILQVAGDYSFITGQIFKSALPEVKQYLLSLFPNIALKKKYLIWDSNQIFNLTGIKID